MTLAASPGLTRLAVSPRKSKEESRRECKERGLSARNVRRTDPELIKRNYGYERNESKCGSERSDSPDLSNPDSLVHV